MRTVTAILAFIIFLAVALPSWAGEKRVYDRDGSLKYRVDESGRIYDKDWNRQGQVRDGRVYDKDWNLKYRIESDRIYDRDGNRKGQRDGDRVYDKDWNLKYRIKEGR